MKLKIYFAGPISGMSGDEVFAYYDGIKKEFGGIATILSPMTGKAELRFKKNYAPEGYDNPVANDHAIVERDLWMVRQADVVFVNLFLTEWVSIGSVSELAWAHLLGKQTVIALEEGNIHEHAFVVQMADIRYPNPRMARDYLKELCQDWNGEGKKLDLVQWDCSSQVKEN